MQDIFQDVHKQLKKCSHFAFRRSNTFPWSKYYKNVRDWKTSVTKIWQTPKVRCCGDRFAKKLHLISNKGKQIWLCVIRDRKRLLGGFWMRLNTHGSVVERNEKIYCAFVQSMQIVIGNTKIWVVIKLCLVISTACRLYKLDRAFVWFIFLSLSVSLTIFLLSFTQTHAHYRTLHNTEREQKLH